MKCNACWRELEGRAISTTCGHLLCTEDASKILSNDGACPIRDRVLSKSLMKPVDINPNDEWVNMVGRYISSDIAYRSVMFYIGQKELEMQYKMNRIVAQCRQKCEVIQAKFTEKLEQVHAAYQKMAKRCQMMEREMENLSKDKQELQEKFAEKSRAKRGHMAGKTSCSNGNGSWEQRSWSSLRVWKWSWQPLHDSTQLHFVPNQTTSALSSPSNVHIVRWKLVR
ncbi:E3 ubiquitin-protein ligase CCNB1IP1 homolog [Cucurbita moschata]|uniref:E3 ubiquitin-protein ligase CCNB1IP1 homolog n=1 Tax=Cucurbita moschata TaxID=3662 RepID=A0A6J1EZC6_CUCMO|nr:E3 ubiquitin-protein ligase CCNB1IP1 homolog [Cucurbita moschata]